MTAMFKVITQRAAGQVLLQLLSENDGRLVGTRTPDLYRVKGQLTNTLNLESDGDRLSTPKYV